MKLTNETSLFFVSSTTYKKRPIFHQPVAVLKFQDAIKCYEVRGYYHLIAYCIMPNHYHLVLRLNQKHTVSQILHNIHSFFVHEYCRLNDIKPRRFWARHSWIVGIDTEKLYWQKIAYTLLNPYRAGLVKSSINDYPYSDISEWKRRKGEKFLCDLFENYGRWGE